MPGETLSLMLLAASLGSSPSAEAQPSVDLERPPFSAAGMKAALVPRTATALMAERAAQLSSGRFYGATGLLACWSGR